MNYGYRLLLSLCVLPIVGCTSTDPLFHRLVVDPPPDILPGDTFVVGVEKARRGYAGAPVRACDSTRTTECVRLSAVRQALAAEIRELYEGQWRPTFISHIAQSDSAGWCFIFNDYEQGPPCPGVELKRGQDRGRVSASWAAVETLRRHVTDYVAAKSPTHIVVYSMGWNTTQAEAIDENFKKLQLGLLNAGSRATFRPLFIAITWPSTGSPWIPGTDYGIKAKDADEVGLLWANAVINSALRAVKKASNIPIVVIGHSFGARVTSRAVFSSALLGEPEEPVVDLLVGLQGAYSFRRFVVGEGKEEAPYSDFSQQVGQVVLTTSKYDTAVTRAWHEKYFIGTSKVQEATKAEQYKAIFAHGELGADGSLRGTCDGATVLFVDASLVIKDRDGRGGAHNDIYGPEIGRATYELIRQCVK